MEEIQAAFVKFDIDQPDVKNQDQGYQVLEISEFIQEGIQENCTKKQN